MTNSDLEKILNSECDAPTMEVKLYNTLSMKKETFKPINPGRVRMYICGPTVYGSPHLGHVRTIVAYDALKEFFKVYKGWDVLHVQNITDVGHIVGDVDEGEDKMEKAARARQIHPMELADTYIKEFWDSFDALKCSRPNISPRATGHIVEMQDWCKLLLDKGYAYEVDGDIYFDVASFKDYRKLSKVDKERLMEGVRIEANPKKRNPADFALWKRADPSHIMQWTSPWGKGYPGWHIECSVMSAKYLGTPFDIHGGARELSFPHHENEIAQSEAYSGKKAVNYWVHTGILTVNGEKMGKSKGNFIIVSNLLKKYSPEQLRWFILSNHYGSSIDFTEATISASGKGLERINNFLFTINNIIPSKGRNEKISTLLKKLRTNLESHLHDDFNTPRAVSEVYTFVTKANQYLAEGKIGEKDREDIISEFKKIDSMFKSFQFESQKSLTTNKDFEVEILMAQRNEARARKDWNESDRIRKLLKEKGVELLDQKDGSTVVKYV